MKARTLILIILLVLIADQALKIYIKTSFPLNTAQPVMGHWFQLYFVENPGMAYGWKFGGNWGKLALTIFRMGAVIFGTWYLGKLLKQQYSKGFLICAALIYAGALGNLIDSMFYGLIFDKGLVYSAAIHDYLPPYDGLAKFSTAGYSSFLHGSVVDMFYFPILENKTFPSWLPFVGGERFTFFNAIFNIADASISVGVLTLLFFQKRIYKKIKADDHKAVTETNTEVNDKLQVL